MNTSSAPISFELPDEREAAEPPEARGLQRNQVRLLVATQKGIEHATFRYLARFLDPGDLVVVNTSATIPAAIDATRAGRPIVVHFSTPLDDGTWTAELRSDGGRVPLFDGHPGDTIELTGGARVEILCPFSGVEGRSRILKTRVVLDGNLEDHLARYGRPISYAYVGARWPLSMYQTVFGRHPGSAEMPSAARPFTSELVTDLIARGIAFAPITLHAGVSSLEKGELPLPERVNVPEETAALVNHTRRAGHRVIAVGTTVTRALETVADEDGAVTSFAGWTDLVLDPDRPARVVDGLITGWHAPEASHLLLLQAVAGEEIVQVAYENALRNGLLWHEFGDSALLLP